MNELTAADYADIFRAQLLRRETASSQRLIKAYMRLRARLQDKIARLEAEVKAMPSPSLWKIQRLEIWHDLLRDIEREMIGYVGVLTDQMQADIIESVRAGLDCAYQLTLANTPGPMRAAIGNAWNALSPGAVETALGYFAEGSPLLGALAGYGKNAVQVWSDVMLEALAFGYNPRKWAPAVANALGRPLSWALNTARTVQLNAYRQSSLAAYRDNAHVVKAWMWRATLDERTCVACLAMDGTVHPLTETLNDHHQGRCAMLPMTVSWEELGITGIEERHVERPTGRQWFESLDEETQKRMFGNNALYEAWKAGDVAWERLSQPYQDAVWGTLRRQATLQEAMAQSPVATGE